MNKEFKNLAPKDNFYQTSLFFPMPVVMVGTLDQNGKTTLGPYSLLAPYYIAGKDYYAFILECRNSSNTAQNILRTGKCTLNFIPDDKKLFKEAVRMGWPGDTPDEKMKGCKFILEDSQSKDLDPTGEYPQIVSQAFQVVECTWMKELDNAQDDKPGELNGYPDPYHNFNGITSLYGAHFILRIDYIDMKEKYWNSIVNGVARNNFPPVPVDYGYRDSKYFWCSRFKKPRPELLPMRETSVSSVRYAAKRLQTDVVFTAILKGAKNINLAKKFIDFATSAECVELAAKNGSYQFLVVDGAKQPQAAIDAGIDKIKTMDYDFDDAKINTAHYVEDWQKNVSTGVTA